MSQPSDRPCLHERWGEPSEEKNRLGPAYGDHTITFWPCMECGKRFSTREKGLWEAAMAAVRARGIELYEWQSAWFSKEIGLGGFGPTLAAHFGMEPGKSYLLVALPTEKNAKPTK